MAPPLADQPLSHHSSPTPTRGKMMMNSSNRLGLSPSRLSSKPRPAVTIMVPMPRDPPRSTRSSSSSQHSSSAAADFQKLPTPLKYLLYACVVNFVWLVLFSSHHLPDTTPLLDNLGEGDVNARALQALNLPPSQTNQEHVLVVIVSNRRDGIIPTVSSILTNTLSRPVDLVLIGDHDLNEQIRQHFMNHNNSTAQRSRIHNFVSLTVSDIQDDLLKQGHAPIWTWPEWGSSRQAGWRNANTLHVAEWDELETHAHELNHLRFYLPHVSWFQHHPYLYFLDDDILVQTDLGHVVDHVLPTLSPTKGLLTPCNIWLWDSACHHFHFQGEADIKSILEMPSLYGDRHVCTQDSEAHCFPPTYQSFLEQVLHDQDSSVALAHQQKAWNFGFSLFALDHWRDLDLTGKYEQVMKKSYEQHVFPETSLTFGLGVSYLAFAGAVECWNDEIMKVRDGFGFIEWERYAKTFGPDFFEKVNVVHYTGPHKPWVANTTVSAKSLQPWLDYMKQEDMPIPDQLSTEPTQNLFLLLASERTGANWVMTGLESHDRVCASGEGKQPETGFPTEVMLPNDMPWLPKCSTKRGCGFTFVRDEVLSMRETVKQHPNKGGTVPTRCRPQNLRNIHSDPMGEHLIRVCNFVQALHGNFTDGNIAKVWVDAFQREDRKLLGCSCPRGSQVKGVKVFADWLTYENYPFEETGPPKMVLDDTAFHGSKVIRLKRKNLWARYLSELTAIKTDMYHVTTAEEKMDQLKKVDSLTVNIEEMMRKIETMESNDLEGDKWAEAHASEVLYVEYEDCRGDTHSCFKRIYEFLGVDPSHAEAKRFETTFAKFDPVEKSLDKIANKGAVLEALAVNGYGKFLDLKNYSQVQLLVYDDSEITDDEHHFHQTMGVNSTVFGRKFGSEGPSAKYGNAIPLLKDMSPETIVVLSATRDVRIRAPLGNDFLRYEAIHEFRDAVDELTSAQPGSVVVSTESRCCASALTHASPGDFFGPAGQRTMRSCVSGESGCEWAGEEKAKPWQTFMQDAAAQQTSSDIYLDASLVAGRASDLLAFILATDIREDEDERAIVTDFAFSFPERVVLDYGRRLFGINREGLQSETNKMCPYGDSSATARARALQVSTSSMFARNSRVLGCSLDETVDEPIDRMAFPRWDQGGIDIEPILEHIDRVESEKASIVLPMKYGAKIDYAQGPEIPYFVDDTAVWTSKLIRDRTDDKTLEWRTTPTEALIRMAHKILKKAGPESQSRWRAVYETLHAGGFPYWAWYGDYKSCNYHNYLNQSIPIFTPDAMADCDHAFPVPNYMNIIDSQPTWDNWRGVFRASKSMYPWESKIRKVVWRGSLSEADQDHILSSARWRLNKLVHQLGSDLYDVGLTSIPPWVAEKVDIRVEDAGGLVKNINPMAKFQQYVAILDMDGNSWSSRYATLLCYNSVVIKVEPKYQEYFYSDLQPWTHFIPIKDDLSDLHETVQWVLDPANDDTVRDIIGAANEWCSHRLIPQELAHDLLDSWESYVRLLDRANPNWHKKWMDKKNSILSASSNLDLIRLRSPRQT